MGGNEIDITLQTIQDKTTIVIEIYPGRQRPYYITSEAKENIDLSSHIRAVERALDTLENDKVIERKAGSGLPANVVD